jgi:hypothetical protein
LRGFARWDQIGGELSHLCLMLPGDDARLDVACERIVMSPGLLSVPQAVAAGAEVVGA